MMEPSYVFDHVLMRMWFFPALHVFEEESCSFSDDHQKAFRTVVSSWRRVLMGGLFPDLGSGATTPLTINALL